MKAPRKFQVFDGGRDKPANARDRGEGARERDELLRLAIQVGGIGALAPSRKSDVARLGLKAVAAGTMANFMSACIAGMLL